MARRRPSFCALFSAKTLATSFYRKNFLYLWFFTHGKEANKAEKQNA